MSTSAKQTPKQKPAAAGKQPKPPEVDPTAVSFEEVLDQEIDQVGISRSLRGVKQAAPARDAVSPNNCFARAHAARLTGLAFSGGGIRSATFNLGIMQGLAEAGVLRRFDYLSTVSGGGYIGSWLAGCVRNGKGKEGESPKSETLKNETLKSEPPKVERVFSADKAKQSPLRSDEPHSIGFLREYSNYLTPRLGILSGDTWAFVAAYLRNLSLNLAILISSFTAVMLLPWIVDFLTRQINDEIVEEPQLILIALIVLIVVVVFIGKNLASCGPGDAKSLWFTNKLAINATVVAPSFFAAWLFAAWIYAFSDTHEFTEHPFFWIVGVGGMYAFGWLAGSSLAWALRGKERKEERAYAEKLPGIFWRSVGLILSGLVGGVLVWRLNVAVSIWSGWPHGTWFIAGAVPPLVVGAILVTLVVQIGITGKYFSEEIREWFGRLAGYLTLCTLIWFGLCMLAMPLWGEHLHNNFRDLSKYGSGVMAWILSTAAGLFSAGDKQDPKTQNPIKGIVVRLAPYVFIVGLLALISIAITKVHLYFMRQADPLLGADAIPVPSVYDIYAFVAFAILAIFLSNRVDINLFSMHLLYRNRLVRCYLGASRSNRQPQPFTGFDPEDDFHLSELAPARGYEGPYPIINSTLNLVRGEELAWQQRKGEAFVFTPLYCGFNRNYGEKTAQNSRLARHAYRPTALYGYREGPLLGTAMAISGAALSPNMGYNSSPALTFLFTVFNVRLGWWMGNPRHEWSWRRSTPWFGVMYLVNELIGNTNDRSGFVYLSDGGHFENLGLYELVRRRCGLIVACDGGEDQGFQFESLAAVIEKCRTDFGVEIKMGNLAEIRPAKDSVYSQSYYVFGTIHYDADHIGTLIYVKATLTGDESVELASYKSTHPAFPNEPTTDQWFTELQFESYRKLGHAIAQKLTQDSRLAAVMDPPKSAAVSA